MRESIFERKLARIKKLDVTIEDHGILIVKGGFEVEGVGYYGMPDYCINTAFLYRLLGVFNYRGGRVQWAESLIESVADELRDGSKTG